MAAFNEFGHDLEITYERTNRESNSYGDIYIIDSNSGKPVKYDLTNTEVTISIKKLSLNQSLYCIILLKPYEYYKQSNGHGFATLIRNNEISKKNPFRMVIKLIKLLV